MSTEPEEITGNILTFMGAELPDDVFIADGTNPWIEVDGVAVTWPRADLAAAPGNDCDCFDQPVPGVLAPMDSDVGVQACDECKLFPGDLEAAQALAALVGGVVKFEQETEQEQSDE